MSGENRYVIDYTEKADSMSGFPDLLCQRLPVLQLVTVHARDVDEGDLLVGGRIVRGKSEGLAIGQGDGPKTALGSKSCGRRHGWKMPGDITNPKRRFQSDTDKNPFRFISDFRGDTRDSRTTKDKTWSFFNSWEFARENRKRGLSSSAIYQLTSSPSESGSSKLGS